MHEYKKNSPVITWENITPPYYDYDYFKHYKLFSFQYKSITFNMINAWWLIEAAALAYAEKNIAALFLKNAGFKNVRYFSGKSSQCYVIHNDQYIIIAFNGIDRNIHNDPTKFTDIIAKINSNYNMQLVDSGRVGKVHRGFKDGLDEIWEYLQNYLNQIHQNIRTVWITGHSTGAALATLAADRYGNVQGLYTFGSPMVGDQEFKNNFLINTYRFVYNNDIISRIPNPGIYHHVGELKQIKHNGLVCEKNRDGSEIHNQTSIGFLDKIKYKVWKQIPDCLKDHVPTLYAIHIWNNLLEQENTIKTGVVHEQIHHSHHIFG
jgi:triacylglycerol lipase